MADTLSERAFAKKVGAALSTVQARRKAGLLRRSARKDSRGRWRIDLAVGIAEWQENAPLRAPADGDTEALRAWRQARARREAALADLAEDELRVSRGELVNAKEIQAKIVSVFTRSRNKLLGLPSKLKQRCPHLGVPDILTVDDIIREALEELANGIENEGAL